ncbi:hypothetical protein ACFYV7_12150 [Nocardia suismassiliense]|uniref:Uncharacterized protein n=1 Tax=Nocardia suismassiliense TaxID=2077092 RepID=A0ABW6QQP7_9NOCA
MTAPYAAVLRRHVPNNNGLAVERDVVAADVVRHRRDVPFGDDAVVERGMVAAWLEWLRRPTHSDNAAVVRVVGRT